MAIYLSEHPPIFRLDDWYNHQPEDAHFDDEVDGGVDQQAWIAFLESNS